MPSSSNRSAFKVLLVAAVFAIVYIRITQRYLTSVSSAYEQAITSAPSKSSKNPSTLRIPDAAPLSAQLKLIK